EVQVHVVPLFVVQASLKTRTVFPIWIRSSAESRCSLTREPFTVVPLALPLSRRRHASSVSALITQCCREAALSSIWIVHAGTRPTVASAPVSSTTLIGSLSTMTTMRGKVTRLPAGAGSYGSGRAASTVARALLGLWLAEV